MLLESEDENGDTIFWCMDCKVWMYVHDIEEHMKVCIDKKELK